MHSPFVYELNDVLMKRNFIYHVFHQIEELREKLLNDNSVIKFEDFGAKGPGLKKATIKQLAQKAAIPPKLGELVFKLLVRHQPQTILELGTSLGIGTSYLASSASKASVYTIEGSPEIQDIAIDGFKHLGLSNIIPVCGNFDAKLPEVLASLNQVDVVYLDGNHTYDATLRYMKLILPKLAENAMVIVDDIYWSKGMTNAWNELIKLEQATVSIDLFRMGLLCFRPKQTKEHFVIRY